MKPHGITDSAYDYTTFDGADLEWWQAFGARNGGIRPKIGMAGLPVLISLVQDDELHGHVARIGRSRDGGHATLLTTAGHMIQFQEPPRTAGRVARPGLIVSSKEIDAAGVALVMAHYAQEGHTFTAETLPFAKSASAGFKERVRGLWADLQQDRDQAPARMIPRRTVVTPRTLTLQ